MCHSGVTGDWTTHAQDHTSKVTAATGCASCHGTTVDYAAFVDPANNIKHDDCYVCHSAVTKSASAAAGDCSQCHSGVTSDFTTHTTQNHTTKVTSATGCASCHSATVDYANFVDPANNIKHDACTTCHNATTNAPIATAGDCAQCHSGVTGDFSSHTTQDHTSKVALQSECSACHTETVDYANFIDAANNKKHDSCTACHNATTNAPTATAGDCSQCHTANYFTNHLHHGTTNNQVEYNVTYDTSQPTEQGCAVCHTDYDDENSTSLGLNSWPTILVEHDLDGTKDGSSNTCANCHSYDGSESAPLTAVQNAISSGNVVSCATCHTDKVPDVSHGSHTATDFVRTPNCTTACHPSPDGIAQMHVALAGDCGSCHVSPSGSGTLRSGALGQTTGSSCADCHGSSVPSAAHHGGASAQAGNCTNCHTDPRPAAGQRVIQAMVCSECHVQMNGSTMEIVAITIGKEGGAGNGTDSGNTYTPITTANGFSSNHTFPNSGGTINNYGVCLECHGTTGKSGYTSAPRMFPYHALPKPGAYSATDNTIGGDGWNNGLDNFGMTRFRGNVNWNTGTNNSYFPVGKGRLNIGYAQHSLAAHATQDTSYKAPNQSAPNTYQTMASGLTFGTVTHPANGYTYFIPNFDPICTESDGCDNITGASVSVAGSRPETSWSVTASSSTGATLHVVHGGRHLGSFSSVGTFTLNVAEEYVSRNYQNLIPLDSFTSENGGPVWVVSEDGGAVNAGTWPGLDWSNLDNVQTGLSYPGTNWPQQ
jgi:hypothetical protein